MFTTFTNDHLKFLRYLFLFHPDQFTILPYGRIFLNANVIFQFIISYQLSDIYVSIGCSSTFLKQLYCQFSILILDFVSGKKKTVECQLYLNYFVSVAILEVYILHWENTKNQIGPKTIEFWKLKKRPCFFSRLSLRDDIS